MMCFSRPRNEKGLQNPAMEKQENQPWWAQITVLRVGSEGDFECHKLNQYISYRYFLAKLFLLIHVSSIAPAQGLKIISPLCSAEWNSIPSPCLNLEQHGSLSNISLFFVDLLWNCNHGKVCQWAWPLSPPGINLSAVDVVSLVQHCHLRVFFFSIFISSHHSGAQTKRMSERWDKVH